ncbi:MAG: response regulator [Sphingobacteriaceae bacterium]|nr:MAG: response regulator [Sphingobacteriaceae bacterium]
MSLITKEALLSVFDLRILEKRLLIICSVTFFTGISLSIYYYFLNLPISSISTAIFCVCLAIVTVLRKTSYLKKTEYFFIFIVSTHLIVSVLVEGTQSGQYFYYFPLLIGIPVIIDYERSNYNILLFNSAITFTSFVVCILLGVYTSPLEHIPLAVSAKVFTYNSIVSLLMTASFGFSFIYSHKLNFDSLIEQKNNTISSRTRFLSTMGHELRTPLNGVIGAVNLLKEEKYLAEDNEYFRILKYCSVHMLNLVNDILDFNKIEAGKLELHKVALNLKQLVTDAALPFYNSFEEKNLKFLIEVDPVLDQVFMIDDIRIIQIMNNLLSNALKFTQKGYVKLSVVCDAKTTDTVTANFTVEDTGLGIDKKDQHKIFEGFWQENDPTTRKYTGSGLGLSICNRLLELMDSSLNLESKKGQGSKFTFKIDFDIAEQSPALLLENKHEREDLFGVRILIAEDNKINMMIAKKILSSYKAEVVCAYNGQEALDILSQDSNFTVMLMDLEMPVMNGFTAITHVKNLYPQLPVIAFTASLIDQQMLTELFTMGFSDFIPKPFEPNQIFGLIKKHLPAPEKAFA